MIWDLIRVSYPSVYQMLIFIIFCYFQSSFQRYKIKLVTAVRCTAATSFLLYFKTCMTSLTILYRLLALYWYFALFINTFFLIRCCGPTQMSLFSFFLYFTYVCVCLNNNNNQVHIQYYLLKISKIRFRFFLCFLASVSRQTQSFCVNSLALPFATTLLVKLNDCALCQMIKRHFCLAFNIWANDFGLSLLIFCWVGVLKTLLDTTLI